MANKCAANQLLTSLSHSLTLLSLQIFKAQLTIYHSAFSISIKHCNALYRKDTTASSNQLEMLKSVSILSQGLNVTTFLKDNFGQNKFIFLLFVRHVSGIIYGQFVFGAFPDIGSQYLPQYTI